MNLDYFIAYLERNSENRKMMAALRRGLKMDYPEQNIEAAPYLLPLLSSEKIPPWDRKRAFMVASLFSWHPLEGGTGNLGSSMHRIPKPTDGMKRRFLVLIDSDEDVFWSRAQQVIGILRSKRIPVNWKQFMVDVQQWGSPKKNVQQEWLKEMFCDEDRKEGEADEG